MAERGLAGDTGNENRKVLMGPQIYMSFNPQVPNLFQIYGARLFLKILESETTTYSCTYHSISHYSFDLYWDGSDCHPMPRS